MFSVQDVLITEGRIDNYTLLVVDKGNNSPEHKYIQKWREEQCISVHSATQSTINNACVGSVSCPLTTLKVRHRHFLHWAKDYPVLHHTKLEQSGLVQ